MPKTRKSLDEQLDALRRKKEAIERQLNAVETRKKETDRKLDTRRKIIVGGALIVHAEIDPEFRRMMQEALQKAVTPKDRPLVADLIRSGVAEATEAEGDTPSPARPSSRPPATPESAVPTS